MNALMDIMMVVFFLIFFTLFIYGLSVLDPVKSVILTFVSVLVIVAPLVMLVTIVLSYITYRYNLVYRSTTFLKKFAKSHHLHISRAIHH